MMPAVLLLLAVLAAAAPLASERNAAAVVMGDDALSGDCPPGARPTLEATATQEPTAAPTATPTAAPTADPLMDELSRLGFEAVWESPGVLLVTLSDEKTHFDVAKDSLKEEGILRLGVLAGILVRYPGNHLQIDGHTDSRGRPAFNQGLSRRRALRVQSELVAKGVDPAAFEHVLGWGPDRPLADNADEAGRAKNRRVEVRIRFHQLEVKPTATVTPEPAGGTPTQTPAPERASSTPTPFVEAATPTATPEIGASSPTSTPDAEPVLSPTVTP